MRHAGRCVTLHATLQNVIREGENTGEKSGLQGRPQARCPALLAEWLVPRSRRPTSCSAPRPQAMLLALAAGQPWGSPPAGRWVLRSSLKQVVHPAYYPKCPAEGAKWCSYLQLFAVLLNLGHNGRKHNGHAKCHQAYQGPCRMHSNGSNGQDLVAGTATERCVDRQSLAARILSYVGPAMQHLTP